MPRFTRSRLVVFSIEIAMMAAQSISSFEFGDPLFLGGIAVAGGALHSLHGPRWPSGRGRRKQRRRRSRQVSRTLQFEPLEDRQLLAVLTVNSLLDNTPAGDGLVTLREAIAAANADAATDLGHTGSGADMIQFAAGLSGAVESPASRRS